MIWLTASQPSETAQPAAQARLEVDVASSGGLSAGPEGGGEEQERRVRELLTREGFEQPFGASDAEIRVNLNLRGNTADFVGYRRADNTWLVAESKGSDFLSALRQLENTVDVLFSRGVSASVQNTQLRIYTNRAQYARLMNNSPDALGMGGYKVIDGYLGWHEGGEWVYAFARGIKVFVHLAP
jgi:hypothetical protein